MRQLAKFSLITLFSAPALRVWALVKCRRQLTRLQDLSDAQLADIGLTRSDVRRVRQLPWTQNPSAVLTRLARENSMEILAQGHHDQPARLAPLQVQSAERVAPHSGQLAA
ncbi:DUF1127 domain-containing protein [Roseibium sp.]|uniref:DUF1127 domain-containing protein n=1 Tax=Roseibium sp. TaxID=1936156 RepID=UPI003A984F57